jgi:hypothetical protein
VNLSLDVHRNPGDEAGGGPVRGRLDGQDVVLHPLEIVSVVVDRLGPPVGSLRERGDDIIRAVDVVISRAWG